MNVGSDRLRGIDVRPTTRLVLQNTLAMCGPLARIATIKLFPTYLRYDARHKSSKKHRAPSETSLHLFAETQMALVPSKNSDAKLSHSFAVKF